MFNTQITKYLKGLPIFIMGICLLLVTAHNVNAATIWCNPTNTGTENGSTKETGYNTLWEARAVMSSGDTIIIADGDWSSGYPGMTISSSYLPPAGTSYASMSTIKAETDWGVRIPTLNDNGTGVEYVKLQGIIFIGANNSAYKWSHCKFIRCGFFAPAVTGNASTFNISYGAYNLMEECISWGGGRYKFLDYHGDHNIYRRCVARHDWYISPDWTGQQSNFRGYGSTNSVWQNCISIDSDREEYQFASNENGDFWVGDQSGSGGNIIDGCVAMKGLTQAFYLGGTEAGDTTVELKNSVALGPSIDGINGLTGAITIGLVIANVHNVAAYHFNTGFQHFLRHNKTGGSIVFSDSIARDIGPLVGGSITAFHNYYYNQTTGDYGINSVNADPLLNGLLYPVRVESGSILSTAGSTGGTVGPTILYKIGNAGMSMDESGWNTVTENPLWPFPNEATIRSLMRTTVDGVEGIYGYTVNGQTLSNYIWGYFGNTVPPFNVRATSPNAGSLIIQWDPPADIARPTITGYKIYDVKNGKRVEIASVTGNNTFQATINGLTIDQHYELAMTAIDSTKGESGISYVRNVSWPVIGDPH
ncbi:MAG: fibronectin type III domain-containing protein [Proteobacteria bacterium]|nr:fibronectin type III domain-containing protein [Pseudomonadota bacterium]